MLWSSGFSQLRVLTLWLLWSEDHDGDLSRVWLADGVCDSQLELVHPWCQIWNHHLVIILGFLQGVEQNTQMQGYRSLSELDSQQNYGKIKFESHSIYPPRRRHKGIQ